MSVSRLLSADETAKILGVSAAQVYNYFHRADFPVVKIGKRLFVSEDCLQEWIRSHTAKTTPSA